MDEIKKVYTIDAENITFEDADRFINNIKQNIKDELISFERRNIHYIDGEWKPANPEIQFDYDEEADVLYAFIDKPVKAMSEEIGNGIILRTDPATNKYVGFTIIDYMKRIKENKLTTIPQFEWVELPKYSGDI